MSEYKSSAKTEGAKSSTDSGFYISYLEPQTYPSYDASITFELHNYDWGNGAQLVFFEGEGCEYEFLRVPMPERTYGVLSLTMIHIGNFIVGSRSYNGLTKRYSECISLPFTILKPPAPVEISLVAPSSSPSFNMRPKFFVRDLQPDHSAKLFLDASCINEIGASKRSFTGGVEIETLVDLNPGIHKIYATAVNEGGYQSDCSSVFATYEVSAPSPPSSISLLSPVNSPFYDDTPTFQIGGVMAATTIKLYSDASCSTEVASKYSSSGGDIALTSKRILPGRIYEFHAKAFLGSGGSSCSTVKLTYNLAYLNNLISFSIIAPGTTSDIYNRPRVRANFSTMVRRYINVYKDATCSEYVSSSSEYNSSTIEFDLPYLAPGNHIFYIRGLEAGGSTPCSLTSINYQVLTNSRLPLGSANNLDSNKLQNIQFSDMNLDGKVDLVAIENLKLVIYLGNGNGTFGSIKVVEKVFTNKMDESFDLKDINNDTFPDIILGHSGDSDGVKIVLSNGSGGYSPALFMAGMSFLESKEIIVEDVHGDGFLDIIQLVKGVSADVIVYKGQANGTFGLISNYSLDKETDGERMELVDLNNDGFLDLVITEFLSKKLSIFVNNGLGAFVYLGAVNTKGHATDIKIRDINNDGKLDMISSMLTQGVSVFIGNGDASFQAELNYAAPATLVNNFEVADVDNDNQLDVIIGDNNGSNFHFFVLFGNGDGSFTPAIDYLSSFSTVDVKVLDLNNDSKVDFIFGEEGLKVLMQ